ncbi:TIGR02147 family protein [Bdellovibrio bacteriovorus]|uniref:TIGR02147 family protein n=1 Tax=Bdellovibrio bacteriovorus TaxID=959 RepID=UPI0035A71D34
MPKDMQYKRLLMNTPGEFLKSVYAERKNKNQRYSLRAFAASLGISSGRLSDILNGRQRMSPRSARAIAVKLGLAPEQQTNFINLNENYNENTRYIGEETIALDLHQFALIADPLHFYILSYLKTDSASSEPSVIARRLNYSIAEVKSALESLEALGFLNRRGDRFYIRAVSMTTPSDIPSQIIRDTHKKRLGRAVQSLSDVAVEERDVTSMTMAIDVKKIPEAKKLIRQFRRKMSKFLEEGEASEVYDLNIQLVKISR